jgi:transposase
MQTEVLTGPERRRRWSVEEKARIVAEASEPGVQIAEVARRHGLSRTQVYEWRRLARRQGNEAVELVPAMIAPPPRRAMSAESSVIEIALPGGVQLTVRGRVDARALRAVLAALRP